MPLDLPSNYYGAGSLANLAVLAGTLSGESLPTAGSRSRAMIIDVGANRTAGVGGAYGMRGAGALRSDGNAYQADGTTLTGVAAQLRNPTEFSTWLPSESAAYKQASQMRDDIRQIASDPGYFDKLPAARQNEIQMNLAAINSVLGTGENRGNSGGATYYINPKAVSSGQLAHYQRLGLADGVNGDGNVFMGNNVAATRAMAAAHSAFNFAEPSLTPKTASQGFNPNSPTNPGVPDATGGTIGSPNFGAGITVPPSITPTSFIGTGGDPNLAINEAYADILGRAPDQSGISFGLSALAGGSLGDYVQKLLNSQEAQQHAVGGSLPGLQDLLNTLQNTPSVQLGDNANVPTLSPIDQSPIATPAPINGDFNVPQLPGVSPTGSMASTPVATQGPTASADPINSIYQAILGRPADAPSLQSFDAQLGTRGMDLNQIAQILAGSPEAQALGPSAAQNAHTYSTADTVFARDLGRLADTAGQQYFDAQTTAGLPTNLVEAQILGSPEAQARGPDQYAQAIQNYTTANGGMTPTQALTLAPFASEFQQATGRPMDVQTQNSWLTQLGAGTSPAILEASLLSAPEAIQAQTGSLSDLTNGFTAKYGLLPEQVSALAPLASQFSQVIGRPVDAPTLQSWNAQITAGTPQSILEASLLQAPEAQTYNLPTLAPLIQNYQNTYGISPTQAMTLAPVASDFQQALGRAPDAPTLQGWGSAIASGMSIPQLTAQVLQAPEVQARTGGQGTLFQQFGSQYGMDPASYLQSLQPAAPAYTPPGINDPFGFSSADVSGYNPNAGGAASAQPGADFGGGLQSLGGSGGEGGSAYVQTDPSTGAQVFASFNPQDSENNFLNSQMTAHAAQQQAGQAPEATNSNVWNANLFAIGQQQQAQQAAQNRTNMANMGMLGPALGGFSNVGTYVAPGSYNYSPQGLFGAPTLFNAPSLGGMFGASSMGTGSFR